MVPPARHGPQRGACLLWIPNQVPTLTRKPLGLLPRPRDYLGATVRGRGHPVLKENLRHVEKRCTDAASSLRKCNKWRTQLRTEFDATSEAMQVVANAPSGRELEHRLSSLQTSLTAIERAITRYENIIEDCRRRRRRSPMSRRRRRSLTLRWLMRKRAVMLSPLTPKGRLILRASLLWIPLVMLSSLRRMPSSCSRHPNPKIQPPDLTAPGARPVRSQVRWPI